MKDSGEKSVQCLKCISKIKIKKIEEKIDCPKQRPISFVILPYICSLKNDTLRQMQ